MSTAAPPPWVRRLRKRGTGVDAGVKVLLITCWGYGPYKRTGPEEPRDGQNPIGAAPERQPAKPVTLWACVETLAEESGQPEGTVKDQLRRAIALGYIRRDKGSRMTLAWREPGCFEYGARTVGRPNRTVDQPDGRPTVADGGPTCPDGSPTPRRTVGRPQTSIELPIELPPNVEEERATPSPTWRQRRAQQELDQDRRLRDQPATGPLTPAMLNGLMQQQQAAAWIQCAEGGEHGRWFLAMGERASGLGLTRDQLGQAVFAYWEAEAAEEPPGVKSGQPERRDVWWASSRVWLRKAAGLDDATPAATARPGKFAMSGALRRIK